MGSPGAQELDSETARFFVKPVVGGNSDGVTKARGIEGIVQAAVHLLQQVLPPTFAPRPPQL